MRTIATQGLEIPVIGFGTFRMPGTDCQPVVESALAVGYRHIDTAAMYDNEAAVGAGIAASGLARKDLHVTTKVWHENLLPDALRNAFDTSLNKLKLDYVDLYLVHWPSKTMDLAVVMETMIRFKEEGRARAIGVCNFNMPMLTTAIEKIGAPIACHQVEYHPYLDQSAMLNYLRKKNIPLVAYAPLAQGRAASDPILAKIGEKHGVTAAQVAIAWLLDQQGVIAIPKAQRENSQRANLASSSIRLDDDDRKVIAALPKAQRFVNPTFAPDWDAKIGG